MTTPFEPLLMRWPLLFHSPSRVEPGQWQAHTWSSLSRSPIQPWMRLHLLLQPGLLWLRSFFCYQSSFPPTTAAAATTTSTNSPSYFDALDFPEYPFTVCSRSSSSDNPMTRLRCVVVVVLLCLASDHKPNCLTRSFLFDTEFLRLLSFDDWNLISLVSSSSST